jgi:glycosyltransferase involved in cell wall biosynthesis
MKILLVGEYSRLHNSLKEGLLALGHEVTLIGCGDYFKDYPVDIKFHRTYSSGFSKKWKNLVYRVFNIDLASISVKKQFYKHRDQLKGYDIVQLINESPFGIAAKDELELIRFLKANNPKLFLLSCGTDYISVKYAFEKKFRYSILSPLFENKVNQKEFSPILKYLTPPFIKLHYEVMSMVEGVIASDLDYHIPMEGHAKYMGLIPNPINVDKIQFIPLTDSEPIVIFHGINSKNYYKKGSDYFEAALSEVKKQFGEKVQVITTRDVPYNEYIQAYNQAHILMDQVLGFDQGYNALEAMAKGKVVFTGAEIEWLQWYQVKENTIAINALPAAEDLVEKLSHLIKNPQQLVEISKNARAFIEKEHHYIDIARRYEKVWTNDSI